MKKSIGVHWDEKKTVLLYHERIETGDVKRKRLFDTCYMDGSAVHRDMKKSVEVFQEAMEVGDVDAKNYIRILLSNGH